MFQVGDKNYMYDIFLQIHPKVLDGQVVGVPDLKYGEEVTACIILKEEITATELEFQDFLKEQLSKFKHPRYIFFMNDFPMTASGFKSTNFESRLLRN